MSIAEETQFNEIGKRSEDVILATPGRGVKEETAMKMLSSQRQREEWKGKMQWKCYPRNARERNERKKRSENAIFATRAPPNQWTPTEWQRITPKP